MKPDAALTPSPELTGALSGSRRVFWHAAGFSLFVNLLVLTGPLYMLQVYDRVLASQSVPTLLALTLLVLVLYGTLGVLEWARSGLFSVAASRFEGALSARAAAAAMALSLSDPGRASDRPIRDLRQLRRFLGGPVPGALFDAPFSPLFLLVLFMLHPLFGLWAIFGAVVLVVVSILNERVSARRMKESEDYERTSMVRSSEMTRNAEVLKALGMGEALRRRWQQTFDGGDTAFAQSGRILSGFSSGTKAFRLFLQSAILGIGAWLVIKGEATGGSMVAASILMGRAIGPLEQIVGQWRTIVLARESWASLARALASVPPPSPQMPLPPIRGEVRVENAVAGPPGSNTAVLKGLTFGLEPGDVLGVLGPSAAGKSSLARVLTGAWPVMSGHVRFDGADISSLPSEALGPQIGYLPQQADLLSGTVRDNICRFRDDATPEAVIAAAQAAGCHDMILHLAKGYDTDIGLGGAYLSAGQRQRIGLARALFGEPRLIILDEPNSNLDGPGEIALQSAIAAAKARGATVIIIAHRPNAIVHCTKLMVLDEGRIREFGPAEEVLAKVLPKQAGANVRTIRPGEGNHG
ncbi:MAG: type I secretion system permease/ATPase [Hyphomonas sp.]|uniref:type I secretion system permease/ATPase n=1 Tax=Hyphomonas sp. TaxID=87 RepID=UPI0017CC55C5|nr:type I secretion system permease/ATPase [Hyphomonas sp.]MBU3922604.1 type I secretion system permease/ATPase [Alphaproteobacteria bacterium]MBA3067247.1 type I secretion system permease/ATPase [Hyphomonas sp.]MBU4063209.1 type I secretion system permease/ATPase [Alphaproteobacteria bacterium]MBU4165371.1 type I secretion system permease/ATPase [Alphaproteobacteria bacterium]MBU4567960.1 type I secretion system permease/ATPase [Alphaproteobacteria bacterium]